MRLGILAALLSMPLAGCGEDDPPTSPTPPHIVLVSETAGGGAQATEQLRALDSPTRLADFFGLFKPPMKAMLSEVAATIDVPAGKVLAGAVAYVGCAAPSEAEVVEDGGGLILKAERPVDEPPECFAEVTTVGLVVLDGALFP